MQGALCESWLHAFYKDLSNPRISQMSCQYVDFRQKKLHSMQFYSENFEKVIQSECRRARVENLLEFTLHRYKRYPASQHLNKLTGPPQLPPLIIRAMYPTPRQPSKAFALHHKLSTNARAQTSLAVSLDESRRYDEALIVYNRAALLLTSYTSSFADSTEIFKKLAQGERAVVKQTRTALSTHLQSVNARLSALRSSATATRDVSTAVLQRRASVASHSSAKAKLETAQRSSSEDPLVQSIEADILDRSDPVRWEDIYGLDEAKRALHEMVVLPALRPDLYSGLRAPGRGVLLFGPPGTGKTLIAKAVATNMKATFFSISASSLNSKFHGESERLVRTLFQVAKERQPSFVFIDEVDSILGSRSENEHEASRRLKTEFMAQFDGAGGGNDDRVYVMAASNRPQDLDDAVRRRLDRRIYVPLPDAGGRKEFFKKVTSKNDNVRWSLRAADFDTLARRTEGFSGADIKALCRETSLMPLRELGTKVSQVRISDVRACGMRDFEEALQIVRPSSNKKQIAELEAWNREFGSHLSTSKRTAQQSGGKQRVSPRNSAAGPALSGRSGSNTFSVPARRNTGRWGFGLGG